MPAPEYPDTKFGKTPAAYGVGRDGKGVRYSVIHYTAGSESRTSAEDGNAYDAVRTDGTSCHVFHDPDSSVQEVLRKDRSNSALHKGNRLGIQHELCGTAQSREQWLDQASDAILWRAAKAVAKDCIDYGLEPRRLSVDEVRRAWYEYPNGPRGICGHVDITNAYPEDHGDHTDPGSGFPWDIFIDRVKQCINSPQGGHVGELSGSDKGNLQAANVNNAEQYPRAIVEWTDQTYGISNTVSSAPVTNKFKARFEELAAEVAEIKSMLAAGGGSPELAPVMQRLDEIDAKLDAHQESRRKAAQAAAIEFDNDPTNDLPV